MNKSCIAAALISAFAFTASAAPLKILFAYRRCAFYLKRVVKRGKFRYAAANALGGHLSMVFLARACCFCWYHPHRFTLLSADLPVDDAVLSRFSGCA